MAASRRAAGGHPRPTDSFNGLFDGTSTRYHLANSRSGEFHDETLSNADSRISVRRRERSSAVAPASSVSWRQYRPNGRSSYAHIQILYVGTDSSSTKIWINRRTGESQRKQRSGHFPPAWTSRPRRLPNSWSTGSKRVSGWAMRSQSFLGPWNPFAMVGIRRTRSSAAAEPNKSVARSATQHPQRGCHLQRSLARLRGALSVGDGSLLIQRRAGRRVERPHGRRGSHRPVCGLAAGQCCIADSADAPKPEAARHALARDV